MSKFLLILGWIGLVALVTPMLRVMRTESVLGQRELRYHPWYAVAVVVPVILMAATRGYIADTGMYLRGFEDMPKTLSGIPAYMSTVQKDRGFYFLSAVIKLLVGGNSVLYLFVIAALQCVILALVYRKYSTHYLLSIFLFLASTDYISWMFNGIRQFTAVVLIFAATKFILNKQWLPTVLLILLASTMHQSALLMLLIVLVVQGRAWNVKTLCFLLAILLSVLYVELFTTLLDAAMQETQYESMVTDWNEWGDDGTNEMRVLVYSAPAVLSLLGLRYIRAANDPLIDLCANMSIVSMGLYIISMFTSGIFMGRLPIYASLYNYILLPWQIEHMFNERSAQILRMAMIGAYLLFYYYQMHFVWGFM